MPSENVPKHLHAPFRLDRCGDLASLRRALEDAGYTEEAVAEKVLLDESGRPLGVAPVMRKTEEKTPFNTLLRMFVVARAVPEGDVQQALAGAELEPLVEMGLLKRDQQGMRAQAALMPADGLWLLRDFWPDFVKGEITHDHVPGVGPSTRITACMTVRRQGELALDLGTGSGFLALLAAEHTQRVIGTDTNPRALNFGALNARLNEISNMELRRGSLYEPVADCRFDLIVANPPFAISPGDDYEYRDSGLSGDTICEQVIRRAGPLLREGGYCSVLFNWHHQNDDDWTARPAAWLAESGCDAWLICNQTFDPVTYACTWLNRQHGHHPQRFERLLGEWVAYYDRLGIGVISSGAVVLRRRSAGPNWVRTEKLPAGQPTSSCSEQIQRIFAAEDLLRGIGREQDLLDMTFRLTADHRLLHTLQAGGGKWAVVEAQLKQTRGFEFTGNVDRLVSTVLAGCDGTHTLRELASDLAAGLGAEAEQVAPGSIGIVRTLLRSGFLTVCSQK